MKKHISLTQYLVEVQRQKGLIRQGGPEQQPG